MPPHADAGAEGVHGAGAAQGGDGLAGVLAKGDQEVVVCDPVAPWQDLPQGEFGLLRVLGSHDSQPVADVMRDVFEQVDFMILPFLARGAP